MKWFHHETDARQSDQLFELVECHGLQGYGFFWALLEECYKADDSGFQIEVSQTWYKRIAKEFGLSDFRVTARMLDTMANIGLIDKQLWEEGTIFVPGIKKRADAYVKKRQDAAERKRRERSKGKEEVTEEAMSRVTSCDMADVTLSDLRSQISDPEEEIKKEKEIEEKPFSLESETEEDVEPGERSPEEAIATPNAQHPQNPPKRRDHFAERAANPGHKYPQLLREGLSNIWIGPGWTDFDSHAERAAIAHLKKHNLPSQLGDAKRYISNLIRAQDWGKLSVLAQESEALSRANPVPASSWQPSSEPEPTRPTREQFAELHQMLKQRRTAARKAQEGIAS